MVTARGGGEGVDESREQLLHGLTVVRLKEICRASSLKLSGKKTELVRRILDHETDQAGDGASSGEEQTAMDSDKFAKAFNNEELSEASLEEIFNIHMPEPGEIVMGTVTALVEFGAFVELDETGWSGLLHVSEITDTFITSVEDYLHPGQKVEVMVIKPPNDRLDRLSLSMKRVPQHSPGAPSTHGPLTTAAMHSPDQAFPAMNFPRRMDSVEHIVNRLQIRLTAVEAVLAQMGHGPALRTAQEEAKDATKNFSVPTVGSLLSGIPEPGEERMPARSAERQAMAAVMEDLTKFTKEGDSNDKETSAAQAERDALAAVFADLEKSEKEQDEMQLVDDEVGDGFGPVDALADMLNDRFIGSASLPKL